jgi:hypothetical protein
MGGEHVDHAEQLTVDGTDSDLRAFRADVLGAFAVSGAAEMLLDRTGQRPARGPRH